MADVAPTPNDVAADLEQLAASSNLALQRKIVALLRGNRFRLIAALYRLDVDEIQARRLLAAAARDQEVDRVAASLAELILYRLRAKVRTTTAHRTYRDGKLSR